jgi:hypothetical protein
MTSNCPAAFAFHTFLLAHAVAGKALDSRIAIIQWEILEVYADSDRRAEDERLAYALQQQEIADAQSTRSPGPLADPFADIPPLLPQPSGQQQQQSRSQQPWQLQPSSATTVALSNPFAPTHTMPWDIGRPQVAAAAAAAPGSAPQAGGRDPFADLPMLLPDLSHPAPYGQLPSNFCPSQSSQPQQPCSQRLDYPVLPLPFSAPSQQASTSWQATFPVPHGGGPAPAIDRRPSTSTDEAYARALQKQLNDNVCTFSYSLDECCPGLQLVSGLQVLGK